VIAVRVQNEPGIIGSSRDYSPEALSVYEGPVPAKLVTRIQPSGKGIMFDFWQKSGSNKSGAWPALFSWEAGEIKTTWKQEYQFLVNIFIVWPPLSGCCLNISVQAKFMLSSANISY
jgi:hypothetical protein